VLLLPLIFYSLIVHAQTDIKKYLSDSIKWQTSYVLVDESNIKSSSILLMKTQLPKNITHAIFKLSNHLIISFLEDTTTCWAMNLLLYEKYRRNPGLYINEITSKQSWKSTGLKNFDIAYWIKKLTH